MVGTTIAVPPTSHQYYYVSTVAATTTNRTMSDWNPFDKHLMKSTTLFPERDHHLDTALPPPADASTTPPSTPEPLFGDFDIKAAERIIELLKERQRHKGVKVGSAAGRRGATSAKVRPNRVTAIARPPDSLFSPSTLIPRLPVTKWLSKPSKKQMRKVCVTIDLTADDDDNNNNNTPTKVEKINDDNVRRDVDKIEGVDLGSREIDMSPERYLDISAVESDGEGGDVESLPSSIGEFEDDGSDLADFIVDDE